VIRRLRGNNGAGLNIQHSFCARALPLTGTVQIHQQRAEKAPEVDVTETIFVISSASRGSTRSPDGLVDIGQCRVIENPCGRVADIFHRDAYPACSFVNAIHTFHIRGLAHTWHCSQWTVQNANHLPEGDFRWTAAEEITASSSLATVDQTAAFQLEQDRFEKLPRDFVSIRQVGNENRLASRPLGQNQKRLQAILGLPGQHAISLLRR
jgi:hypothetical protein